METVSMKLEPFEIRYLLDENLFYGNMSSKSQVLVDEIILDLFDNGKILVIGYPKSGKTYLIEQVVANIEEYSQKLDMPEIRFLNIHHGTWAQINHLPGKLDTFIEMVHIHLQCNLEDLCIVTELPQVAETFSVVFPKVKVILETNIQTYINLINAERSGVTKVWGNFKVIDANEVLLSKKEMVNALARSQKGLLEKSYKSSITKKEITLLITYFLKNLENSVIDEGEYKGSILISPGVFSEAVRTYVGLKTLSENQSLQTDNQFDSGKTIRQVFKMMKDDLEERIETINEDNEGLPHFLIDMSDPSSAKNLPPELREILGNMGLAVDEKENKKEKVREKPFKYNDMNTLEERLGKQVLGQGEAVKTVTESMMIPAAGLNDTEKPLKSFLFLGPTGVGKTKLALTLAEELGEEPMNLIRLDMSEYSHDHEVSKLFGCFVKDSKVWMSDGTSKNIQEVTKGDRVVSHSGYEREVIDTHEYSSDGEKVEIGMAGQNGSIVSTANHEYYAIRVDDDTPKTPTEKQLEWHEASTLREGDWVAIPRPKINPEETIFDLVDYLPESEEYKLEGDLIRTIDGMKVNRFINLSPAFARLAGFYLSKGEINENMDKVSFTFDLGETFSVEKNLRLVNQLSLLIETIFGENPYKIGTQQLKNSLKIVFPLRVMASFFAKIFSKDGFNKRVPKEIVNSSRETRLALVESLLLDSGLTIPDNIKFFTTSEDLHNTVSLIIRSLGVDPYESLVEANTVSYGLHFPGDQASSLVSNSFNRITKNVNSTDSIVGGENYTYYRVLSVRKFITDEKVYDLSVEEDTSYCVNKIAVHNSPPGYVGHTSGGVLTNAVKKNPYSVILLDEIEKAHDKVYDQFLQLLDAGRMTTGSGETIDFTKTVVVMTSNLGIQELSKVGLGFSAYSTEEQHLERASKSKNIIAKALEKTFRPEFLNRIDEQVVFNELPFDIIERIIIKELKILEDRIGDRVKLRKPSESISKWILEKSETSKYGAREIQRVINREVSVPLARSILTNPDNKSLKMKLVSDTIRIEEI